MLIDAYFAHCESTYATERPEYPTVTGLALSLDMTRTGLLDYCEKSTEFANTIKKAKARVERFIEQRLYSNNATGCIFNLKNNFGWKDKSETDINANISLSQALNEFSRTGGNSQAVQALEE